jgi:hypothetical protein
MEFKAFMAVCLLGMVCIHQVVWQLYLIPYTDLAEQNGGRTNLVVRQCVTGEGGPAGRADAARQSAHLAVVFLAHGDSRGEDG